MKNVHQLIPFGTLVAGAAVASIVVTLEGQTPAPVGDFRNATVAQVRDAQGQVVLQGHFAMPVEEDGGLERLAILAPAGADTDAKGEAELEFTSATPIEQEVEFSVQNLAPAARFVFVIDGIEVATATTDRNGRAEVELDIRMPSRD